MTPGPAADEGPSGELERLRSENEALSAVLGLVASSPDLGHVLARVVDLLTRVSGCHACFFYLLVGDRLELRAASPVYSRHVGHVAFSSDEGLAGWSMRNRQPAFIREHASEDPRTNFVPELEEERFQSMAAVPVPARSDDMLGVITLHTAAPHEFDERILKVLTQTASIIAGAIENAKLYDEAQRRVEALTRLSALSQEVAAATRRTELYAVATAGVRQLLPCDRCRLLELDGAGRLVVVAQDPPLAEPEAGFESTAEVLLELMHGSSSESVRLRSIVGRALGVDEAPRAALAVPISAGAELLGVLVVGSADPWAEHGDELLRALAPQLAGALKKAELIESLSDENKSGELYAALTDERWDIAQARARTLGCDLDREYVALEVRPARGGSFEPDRELRLERALRQAAPGTVCEADGLLVRALAPTGTANAHDVRRLADGLRRLAAEEQLVIGCSAAAVGYEVSLDALGQARDAAAIALRLHPNGVVLQYDELGAYRYLVALADGDGPRDRLRDALDQLTSYDRDRGAQLLPTLEIYLDNGCAQTATARELMVHVNTLRQRLDRVRILTGIDLASEDRLALQIAIKVARLRGSEVGDG